MAAKVLIFLLLTKRIAYNISLKAYKTKHLLKKYYLAAVALTASLN